MNSSKAIMTIAQEQGISEAQARADMIVAIHHAYLAKKPAFTILFGDREPSLEEFIQEMAKEMAEQRIIQ